MAARVGSRGRLKLKFVNENRQEILKCWYQVNYEKAQKVVHVIADIQRKFGFQTVELELMDFLVPAFEESNVLRDNEEVVVVCQNEKKRQNTYQASSEQIDELLTRTDDSSDVTKGNYINDTLEIMIGKKHKKHKKEKKRKQEASCSVSEDADVSHTEKKKSKLSSSNSSEDENTSLLNSETVFFVNDATGIDKNKEPSDQVPLPHTEAAKSDEILDKSQQDSLDASVLSTTEHSKVEEGTKRKRIRKRKRKRKSESHLGKDDVTCPTPLTDSATSRETTVLSVQNTHSLPDNPAPKTKASKRPAAAFHNQHVRFYSESDSGSDSAEVFHSTRLPDTHSSPTTRNKGEKPATVGVVSNVDSGYCAVEQSCERQPLLSSVSDTVLETMSPIPVRAPTKLEKKTLSNGAAVFIRPRRGLAAAGEMGKQPTLSRHNNQPQSPAHEQPGNPADETAAGTGVAPPERQPVTVVRDLSQFPPLSGHPRVGDVIAYKVLEISEEYTPELSNFKVAEVVKFDVSSHLVFLNILSGRKEKKEPGKFDLYLNEEPTEVSLHWSLLQDTRLMPENVAAEFREMRAG